MIKTKCTEMIRMKIDPSSDLILCNLVSDYLVFGSMILANIGVFMQVYGQICSLTSLK